MARLKKFPHIYVILLFIVFLSAALTYVIPSGEYDRHTVDGREVVDPTSFHSVDKNPTTLLGFFMAVPKGLIDTANIIFFIFIVGGSFGVIEETRAIKAALSRITILIKGRGLVAIPLIMLAFGAAGATFGMAEETLPFIPIVASLMISLGFDSMTGAVVVLCGAGAGFAAALTNPFTIGIAQGIAGLPLFSGLLFRTVMLIFFESLTITYTYLYAKKISKTRNLDKKTYRLNINSNKDGSTEIDSFGAKEKIILIIFILTLIFLVFGVIKFGWYMTEIAALFFAMSMIVAAIGGLGFDGWAKSLSHGMEGITSGALIVGFAKAVPIVLIEARVLDTILHALAGILNLLPPSLTCLGMYLTQCLLNFLLPSGGGQAAVSMPIMSPLCDMVGVTRQTAVIAFQLGDGISNVFFPTSGYFMAALALVKIDWSDWARAVAPLIIMQYILGAGFVVTSQIIHLGPF